MCLTIFLQQTNALSQPTVMQAPADFRAPSPQSNHTANAQDIQKQEEKKTKARETTKSKHGKAMEQTQ